MKAYFKEASGKGNANLVVYNPRDDLSQRGSLFAIKQFHDYFDTEPERAIQATNDFYRHTINSSSSTDRICAKISKILADAGYPVAYLVLFKNKPNMLENLTQHYERPGSMNLANDSH